MLTNIPDQQCGESFFMDCDTDMDGFIREDEWSVCLGCPGNNSHERGNNFTTSDHRKLVIIAKIISLIFHSEIQFMNKD